MLAALVNVLDVIITTTQMICSGPCMKLLTALKRIF